MMLRAASRSVRVVLVVALTLLATVGLVGTASAHATLIGSDPADGATLQAAPTTVTLTFDDSLEDFEPLVTVTGPDGSQFQSGEATIDGAILRSAVRPLTTAGGYTIAYRVVSDDGHPVEGQVRFDLAVPAPASVVVTTSSTASPAATPSGSATPSVAGPVTSSADTAASSSSTGWSAWQWLTVALVVILAFGASMIIRRRLAARGQGPSDSSPGPHG